MNQTTATYAAEMIRSLGNDLKENGSKREGCSLLVARFGIRQARTIRKGCATLPQRRS